MKKRFGETPNPLQSKESVELDSGASERRLAELEPLVESFKKAESLLQGEQSLTEKIARGDPLQEILDEACQVTERALHGSLAIIMLLEGNRLRRGAAPRLAGYIAEVDGFEIDPRIGACSAAAARKERVIISDIATDPHWTHHQELAARHDLRAGWATPILSSTNTVLGTFALYWPEPRSPTPHHLQVIDQMVRLLALAIQRKEAAQALRASEKLARSQAEALTQTLDALARETDPSRSMEHVLRTITTQFKAHSCSVWLRDPITNLMVFAFAFEDGVFKNHSEAKLAKISPSMPVEAIPTWAKMFRTKRPIVLPDIRIDPEFPWRAHLLELGVITMLAVPMIVAGEGGGLIGIRFTRKRTFSGEELDLAQLLANQAMLAIQLARLSAQSHLAAMAEERNRVAREMHDTLAQGFTGVIGQLEAARGAIKWKTIEKLSEHLDRAGDLARDGLREARRSVQALRPLALQDKLLTVALRDLIEKMTAGMPMKATFAHKGETAGFSQDWEINLLRICQEMLTNAIRHSQAKKFDVLLTFGGSEILLEVQDDGVGFDSAKAPEGFGLRGIKERVSEMGGKCTIQSEAGKGTAFSILVPIKTSGA
jgi:signal transduction histidine kinase